MLILLIGGYGVMGRKYVSKLHAMQIFPHIEDNLCGIKHKYGNYTHFIIATPPATHAPIIQQILSARPDAKILCEKPVVTKKEDLDLVKLVSAAMIERFSPLLQFVDFNRYDKPFVFNRLATKKHPISPELDLLVHDVDLLFANEAYILQSSRIKVKRTENRITLDIQHFGVQLNAYHHEYEETAVAILEHDGLYDWRNSVVKRDDGITKYYGDKLQRQIENFLNGNRVDSYKAHEFILCQLPQIS